MSEFIKNNAVLFECFSGKLSIGDLINQPKNVKVPKTGLGYIPAKAIRVSKAKNAIAIDVAQMFFIDSVHYESIQSEIEKRSDYLPDHKWF